jgi:hemolysin activation/secretion protein
MLLKPDRFPVRSLGALLLILNVSAQAQLDPYSTDPLDRQVELPDFAPAPVDAGNILPPILPESTGSAADLLSGQRFVLRGVHFTGNMLFSDAELQALVRPLLDTEIGLAQLQGLRDRISRYYIDRGYISSGALIPEQQVTAGVVEMHIIEGRLNQIDIQGTEALDADYVRSRLLFAAQPVLNLAKLEQALYLLQQDPRIRRIDAQLKPGDRPGQSLLAVKLLEANPVQQFFGVNNHHAPAIGAEGVYYNWRHLNWSGQGDTLMLGLEKTRGLNAIDLLYDQPLNGADDHLGYFLKLNDSDVIEGDFEALDIASRSGTLGLSFRHPVERSTAHRFDWFINAELRRSESYLLGDTFSFSPGPENGVSRISVLRTGTDMQWRSSRRVIAARATLSIGLDVLDATRHDDETPDGVFTSLLLQGQWAQRFETLNSTLVLRMDAQFADNSLLGLEQLAIGGHATVRGYRENSLVRDQGAVASIEWRVPYFVAEHGAAQHAVALFYDVGYASNIDAPAPEVDSLSSVGMGLTGQFSAALQYQLYWADALDDELIIDDDDLQDEGIHFSISYHW